MENAVEALKIAGSMLLFILALSIAMLSFTKARQTIDTVMSFSDRETLTPDNSDTFYYLSTEAGNNSNRYVGLDTIIPSIYRAFKEQYKIIFKFQNNDDLYLYKIKDPTVVAGGALNYTETNSIGLLSTSTSASMASDDAKLKFLKGILYGDFSDYNTPDLINNYGTPENAFKKQFTIEISR